MLMLVKVVFVGLLYAAGDGHVEDLELISHEACENDVHHGHSHGHSHDHGHGHGHGEHDHGSNKKITGTHNKILQGKIIFPLEYINFCVFYLPSAQCILPILLYGSECWAVTKRDLLSIDALNQWCLRELLGIKWYHYVRNNEVRRTPRQPHLSAIVQARRFSMLSHIARMTDETDSKKIITASPLENWRRPPGRPRTTWMKTIQQDLKSNNLSLKEAINVAQNCPLWRLVSTYALLVVLGRNEWINDSAAYAIQRRPSVYLSPSRLITASKWLDIYSGFLHQLVAH